MIKIFSNSVAIWSDVTFTENCEGGRTFRSFNANVMIWVSLVLYLVDICIYIYSRSLVIRTPRDQLQSG